MSPVYPNHAAASLVEAVASNDPEAWILQIWAARDRAAYQRLDKRSTSFIYTTKPTPAVALVVSHKPVPEQVQDLTAQDRG